jgi:catechol 2,3-dioxygenase
MTKGSSDLSGGAPPAEPAEPGTYGEPPRGGWRLPDGTRPGTVRLQVASLDRSLAFYTEALGLRTLEEASGRASLAPRGEDRALLELVERPGARPAGRPARLGLYHAALLLPDRAALGRLVRHLGARGVGLGAGDHLVSEAFYLHDPDGLGLELYADRPRSAWRRSGRELLLATDPVDVEGVLASAGEAPWTGMPAGTAIGHVHLHVGDLEAAGAFYADALGFDRMSWSYPGALFLGAGGYHHHLGTNVWTGRAAIPAGEDEARLLEWTLELPGGAAVEAAARSIEGAGHPAAWEGAEFVTADPWGTPLRLRAT